CAVGVWHIGLPRGEGGTGTAHPATRHAQAVKRLRAGDFVYKVQVNVNERGLAVGLSHDVLFPNFLKECSWCGHSYLLPILEISRRAWGATPRRAGDSGS